MDQREPGNTEALQANPIRERIDSMLIGIGSSALLAAAGEADAGLRPDITNGTLVAGAALVAIGAAAKLVSHLRGK